MVDVLINGRNALMKFWNIVWKSKSDLDYANKKNPSLHVRLRFNPVTKKYEVFVVDGMIEIESDYFVKINDAMNQLKTNMEYYKSGEV